MPDNETTRSSLSSSGGASLREKVREAARQVEAEMIMKALEKHRWNRRRAAEALKISYRSLMYKMNACNLRGETPVVNEQHGDPNA